MIRVVLFVFFSVIALLCFSINLMFVLDKVYHFLPIK